MKIRLTVIAAALVLASTPGHADWAKVKEAASELGTAVSDALRGPSTRPDVLRDAAAFARWSAAVP